MTREQAKREIDSLDYYLQNHTDDYGEESHMAMMMAIKALEQEPCEDAISRTEFIVALMDSGIDHLQADNLIEIGQIVFGLPSVIPSRPTEPSEDTISRQAVDEAIYDYSRSCDVNYAQIMEYIDKIPSVNPQEPSDISNDGTLTVNVEDGRKISRVLVCGANHWGGLYYPDEQEPKTGHWISHYDEDEKEGWYECDRCHTERAFNTKFCPDCGTKMVEPQESEGV